MILHIAKHRLFSNIKTFRFSISFILCIVLFGVSTMILTRDYINRLNGYREAVQQNEQELQDVYSFARLQSRAIWEPSPLSIVCEGATKQVGNAVLVGFDRAPTIAEEGGGGNPLFAVFTVFDLATIVEMILSLLAIMFAYNAISGERELGTLKLALSNNVPRHSILMGNYLGGMVSLLIPLAAGFIISTLIMQIHPLVVLRTSEYAGIAVIFLFAALYLGVWYAMGMFLSVMIRRSATVLILLLVFWVVSVIFLPNAVIYAARIVSPAPDRALVESQAQELVNEWVSDMNRYADSRPNPQAAVFAGLAGEFQDDEIQFLGTLQRMRTVYTGRWPYAYRFDFTIREMMEWYVDGSVYGHNLRMDYEDRIGDLHRHYRGELERQASLVRKLSLLSPSWSFYHACSYLADTGEGSYIRFLDESARYRREIIDYMKSRGALDSHLLFTRKPPQEFPSAREALMLRRTAGEEVVTALADVPVEPLELSGMPRFAYQGERTMIKLAGALAEGVELIILNILFMTLAWVAFIRADVR